MGQTRLLGASVVRPPRLRRGYTHRLDGVSDKDSAFRRTARHDSLTRSLGYVGYAELASAYAFTRGSFRGPIRGDS
jgi:hypothetical protein